MSGFFDGFALEHVTVPAGHVRLRRGGAGPPIVLLHGNPQTHAMWHAVAPAMAERFTVYCPDLRGYGGSPKPPASPDHGAYAKREMAGEIISLMDHFGHQTFRLAGHDRGGRVAHRLALDHGTRVERLAVLDIVPTLEHFERTDMTFAMGYYHWFWLAQPHPFPEVVINAAPDAWFAAHTGRGAEPQFFHPQARAEYLAAARDPDAVRGMCEDYRGAATIDLEHDRASRAAGDRIACPLHVLWGAKGRIAEWYDPMALWGAYASGPVSGRALDAGHYMPEEAPQAVIAEFLAFFEGAAQR